MNPACYSRVSRLNSSRHNVALLVGTLDTKLEPVAFLAQELARYQTNVVIVDLSPSGGSRRSLANAEIIRLPGKGKSAQVSRRSVLDEAANRIDAFGPSILARVHAHLIVGLGGSAGSYLISRFFQFADFETPKLLITTVPHLAADLAGLDQTILIPSFVDLEGMNPLLEQILARAAAQAIAVSATTPRWTPDEPIVAVTQLGVTTLCAQHLRKMMAKRKIPTAFFHAVGSRANVLPELAGRGRLSGVVDLTISDLATARLRGAQSPWGRLERLVQTRIPLIVVPGAVNSIIFEGKLSLPRSLRGRRFVFPTPGLCVLRANAIESALLGRELAVTLNKSGKMVTVLIPLLGFSESDRHHGERAYSWSGKPAGNWYDPQANNAFTDALEDCALPEVVKVIKVKQHINDRRFAKLIAKSILPHT